VQVDGRRPAGVIGAAANARLVGQLRTVNETLGRSRALSPCGHFHPANRSDTCSVREITRADLVLVPSAQSLPHGVRSGPGHSDGLLRRCRQVTGLTLGLEGPPLTGRADCGRSFVVRLTRDVGDLCRK
jgi:hypothetical protein